MNDKQFCHKHFTKHYSKVEILIKFVNSNPKSILNMLKLIKQVLGEEVMLDSRRNSLRLRCGWTARIDHRPLWWWKGPDRSSSWTVSAQRPCHSRDTRSPCKPLSSFYLVNDYNFINVMKKKKIKLNYFLDNGHY